MKKYISFLSAFFAYFLAYPQSFPGILTDRVEKLDAMLDDAIANQRVPGLVAMVLKDGELVYHEAKGYADVASKL